MWYIVYSDNPADPSLGQALQNRNIEYYIPIRKVELLSSDGSQMLTRDEYPLGRLIFVRTDGSIHDLIKQIDSIRCIYKDLATNMCATVGDGAMDAFRLFLGKYNDRVLFLKDPYSRFADKRRVRVRAGEFAGQEGRIVKIFKKRKFVIEVGTFAVVLLGIDPSLLEPIDD